MRASTNDTTRSTLALLALMALLLPGIAWAQIARGMGVPSVAVETAEDMAKELQRGLAEPGPYFVELLMAD